MAIGLAEIERVSTLILFWWFFVVGNDWVKEAGNAYAKAAALHLATVAYQTVWLCSRPTLKMPLRA